MAYAEYPKMMTHPNYQPAVLSRDTVNRDGSINHASPGRPAKFPPVYVNNKDQELQYASLGYVPNGESDPEAYHRAVAHADEPAHHKHIEYPKYLYQYSECADAVMDILVHSEADEKKLKGKWYPNPGMAMEAANEVEDAPAAPAAGQPAKAVKSAPKKSAKKPAAKGKAATEQKVPEGATEGAGGAPADAGNAEA